jgi:hypothetical protein
MKNMYNGPMWLKYALYGVLGFELSLVSGSGWWVFAVAVTVIAIEQLGIIQSRRF